MAVKKTGCLLCPQRYRECNGSINEVIDFPGARNLLLFFEKKLFGGLVMRFEAKRLLNANEGRERFFFADGIAGGMLTSRELRARHKGRRLELIFRGSF